jgi:hypothetical protein
MRIEHVVLRTNPQLTSYASQQAALHQPTIKVKRALPLSSAEERVAETRRLEL